MRKTCLACGEPVLSKYPLAKYCTRVCKNRFNALAWNKRFPDKKKQADSEYYLKNKRKVKKQYPDTIRGQARMAGFRSGFERTLDIQLKKANAKYGYETMKIPWTFEGVYNPDFILDNGIIIEAKGKLDSDDRRKMIAVKKQYPHLDIRFVFMNAHGSIVGGKQTNAAWAEKNGFPWAHKEIPEEWIR